MTQNILPRLKAIFLFVIDYDTAVIINSGNKETAEKKLN